MSTEGTAKVEEPVETAPPPPKKSKWKKRLFWTIFTVIIVVVLVVTMYNDFSNPDTSISEDLLQAFQKHWWWLLLAIAATISVFLCRSFIYSLLLHFYTGKPRFLASLKTVVIGRFYEAITPLGTGAQPFQINYLQKKGVPDGAAISMPVVEYCVGRLVTVFMSILALFLCTQNVFGDSVGMHIGIYIAAAFGIVVNLGLPVLLFLSLFSRKACLRVTRATVAIAKFFRLTKDPEKLYTKIITKLEANIQCMKMILKRKRLMLLFVFSIGAKLAHASIGYFVIKAFGFVGDIPGLGWPEIVTINIIITSAITWVPTPGNAGAAEASFYWVFFNAIPGAGAVAMLIWRFLTYYSTILVGFIVSLVRPYTSKHKVILVAGHCGTGKTTAVTYLKENLPNNVEVYCDEIMWNSILTHPQRYESFFGVPVDTTKTGMDYIIGIIGAGEMTLEKHKQFVDTALPFVEKQTAKQIKKLKKSKETDYIIAEWTCSGAYKKLWNAANYRIMIKAKSKEKHRDLLAKRTKRQGAKENAESDTDIRYESMKHLIDNATNIDFEIHNGFDPKFFKDLEKIVKKIKK